MTGRERILAALDGQEPDRVPLALAFYRVDGAALAPKGAWRDDLVDVGFVDFPVSVEESELRRRAMPNEGDTRLGSPSQVARYASWSYHPEMPDQGNPLERARSLADLERFPFPAAGGPRVVEELTRQVDDLHRLGLAAGGNTPHLGGELFEAAWRLRGLESFLIDLVERKEMAHFLLDRLAELARRQRGHPRRSGRRRPGPGRRHRDAGHDDDQPEYLARVLQAPAGRDHRSCPGREGRPARHLPQRRALRADPRRPRGDRRCRSQPAPAGAHGRGPHPAALRHAACALGHRRPADHVRLCRSRGDPAGGADPDRDAGTGGARALPRPTTSTSPTSRGRTSPPSSTRAPRRDPGSRRHQSPDVPNDGAARPWTHPCLRAARPSLLARSLPGKGAAVAWKCRATVANDAPA